MQETLEMVGGGRLGDFLHQLYIPKIFYLQRGIKTNLCISDNFGDSFSSGAQQTYEELKKIIYKQNFINSFKVNEYSENAINLSSWRSSPLLYNFGWTDILINTFMPQSLKYTNLKILTLDSEYYDNNFEGCLIANRSLDYRRYSSNNEIPMEIIKKFPKNKRFFVCNKSDFSSYESYPFKEYFNFMCLDNLNDFFKIINSCELYMGNLTGITAIAYALKKNMLCEFGSVDSKSYSEEVKYNSNISYYNNDGVYANNYIKNKLETK